MTDGRPVRAARQASPDEIAAEKLLIGRCQTGDRDAFDRLMKAYERRVFNFAYRLTGNYDDASDIAADTFVRTYGSIRSFRGDSSFATWLFRVTTNIYLDSRKRQKTRQHQSLEEALETDDSTLQRQFEGVLPDPEDVLMEKERNKVLQRAVASLPDYQRAMVLLYHVEGKSYEEIAEFAKLPIGTVKSRLNRARLALRSRLEGVREQVVG